VDRLEIPEANRSQKVCRSIASAAYENDNKVVSNCRPIFTMYNRPNIRYPSLEVATITLVIF